MSFIELARHLRRSLGFRMAGLTQDDIRLINEWDSRYLSKKHKIEKEHLVGISDSRPMLERSSDTFFILGSGPSINSITTDQWRLIARHDSVGINFFLVHSFVPTYSYIEVSRNPTIVKVLEASRERDLNKRRTFFINIEHKAYAMAKQIIRDNEKYDFYITEYRRFKTRDEAQLSRVIRALADYGSATDLLIHHCASIAFFILLAAAAGYSKIVLVGVDLNRPGYFFYDEDKYRTKAALLTRDYKQRFEPIGEAGGKAIHVTADASSTASYGELNILSTVKAIQEALGHSRRFSHVELYCGAPGSALCPMLRPFEFD